MSIKLLLEEEIQSEIGELGKIQVGTEEYKLLVDGITKLTDRVIEMDKVQNEKIDKVDNREIDYALKTKQMRDENIDRVIRNVITVAGIVLPLGVTIWGTAKSFEFEKDGTITTIIGRGFINKLLPKK